MRFSAIVSLTTAALLFTANASYAPINGGDGLQEVLDDQPITLTRTTTRTRYHFTTITKTLLRAETTATPTSLSGVQSAELLPKADAKHPESPGSGGVVVGHPLHRVQTWYGGQRHHGCDRTACASCRLWYKCQSGEPSCFNCDTAPYCSACTKDTPTPKTAFHDSRKTCSLGPGRTVPCNLETVEHIFEFGGDDDGKDTVPTQTEAPEQGPSNIGRTTCNLSTGRRVPCEIDKEGNVIVFG